MEVGEGLICIYHSVSPTLNGGGGGAHLHLPQFVSLYLEWRWGRGSLAFTTVCLLPRMEVGEGLICIYHGVSPSTLNRDGGVAHLHLTQCVSLYLERRWGRGSFCIYHSVSPSTLSGGGGGAHLRPSQCHSLYLGWRWERGSFVFTIVCLLLP